MPTISIIIPAYNVERTILETIESVQQQTFSNFEIIVINDGSTDQTLEVLKNVQDERLKVFSYENGGVSVARNRGISYAKGQFIAFLDADDLWTPDKLELQLAALQHKKEAGVAYSWTYFKYEKEERSYADESNSFEGNVYADLLLKNFLHNGSNPLIRREAIEYVGFFDPTLKIGEDWDFYLRLAARWPFVLVRKPQIIYRQYPSSSSSQIELMEKDVLIMLEQTFKSAPLELQHLKNQSLAAVYKYGAQQYLKYRINNLDDINRAGQRLVKAVRLRPQILLEEYTQGLIRLFIKRLVLVGLFSQKL